MNADKRYIIFYMLILGSTMVAAAISHTRYAPAEPLSYYNIHGITISGKSFEGSDEAGITLNNCSDVIIRDNLFSGIRNVGIYLYHCKNITIEHNSFTRVSSGVYADHDQEGGIKVEHNEFLNMEGPYPRGQFVQFNNVAGPENSISYNKGENKTGQSHPEDAISLYQSFGSAESPIKIMGNLIRGGGPSASGGGIMLGDNGGAWLLASANVLVDPGQYGMAIAGGDHNAMIDNVIYGKMQAFTNVGMYVNSVGGHRCTNAIVRGNKVKFFNKVNYENNAWLAPGTEKPEGWDTNQFGAQLDEHILPTILLNKIN
jgi:parallel beta-helix repeat protein